MSSPAHPPPVARRRGLAAALLGAACLVGAGVAYGQSMGFTYDPAQLPETKGTLKQYTLTPRGDVDGLILQDGTEVKVPPHLSAQIVFAIRPGDSITVRGLKAAALPLVSATTVRNDATGATVQDDGGPRAARDRPETLVTGRIAVPLHGPRGETNGVLLDNGMTVRMSPEDAYRLGDTLRPNQPLSVRGTVTATLLGQVMEARAVGATPDQLTYMSRPPKPPKEPRGPRAEREDRDPRRTAAFFGPPPPAPDAPLPPGPGAPPRP